MGAIRAYRKLTSEIKKKSRTENQSGIMERKVKRKTKKE